VKKVDFNDLEARNDLQRRVEDEKKRKCDNVWRERVKRVRKEMEEARWELEECVTQLDACFCLLKPDPAGDFDLGHGEEKSKEDEKRNDDEDDEYDATAASREGN
jgi:seryl-tRNA synthetase